MGAFMYFGLVLGTVLGVGFPLVIFQLMLETIAERSTAAGIASAASAERSSASGSIRPSPSVPPPSMRPPVCV